MNTPKVNINGKHNGERECETVGVEKKQIVKRREA